MARAWARLPESSEKDDNPDISNYVGRAEVAGFWNVNKDNTLGITLRHALRTKARLGAPGVAQDPGRQQHQWRLQRPALSHPAVQRLRRLAGGLQPAADGAELGVESGGFLKSGQPEILQNTREDR